MTTLEIHVIIRHKLNQENINMKGTNTMTVKTFLEENGFNTTDGNIYVLPELNETIIINDDNITFKSIDKTVYAPTENDKIDFILNFIISCYTTCFLA